MKQSITLLLLFVMAVSLGQNTSDEIRRAQERLNQSGLEEHEEKIRAGDQSRSDFLVKWEAYLYKELDAALEKLYNDYRIRRDPKGVRKVGQLIQNSRKALYQIEREIDVLNSKKADLHYEINSFSKPIEVFREFQRISNEKDYLALYSLYDPYHYLNEDQKKLALAFVSPAFQETFSRIFHDMLPLSEPEIGDSMAAMEFITGDNMPCNMIMVKRNDHWFLKEVSVDEKKK